MGDLSAGIREGFRLLFTGDPETFAIISVSLETTLAACLIASAVGLPVGFLVGRRAFRGRSAVLALLNTLMALPTVVVGLAVYAMLSRSGPLGDAGLLFTKSAMVIGQAILAAPLIAALSAGAVASVGPGFFLAARSLALPLPTEFRLLLREAAPALLAAVAAGFGRVIAEVGVAMMLGGNLKGSTRTMTTAIALETGKGEFALGFALGVVLLSVSLAVNGAVALLARREGRRAVSR